MNIQQARERAAQAWRTPSTSKKEMDVALANAFADILMDVSAEAAVQSRVKVDFPEGPGSGLPGPGFTIEHILLSVTVVHTNRIIQYDDSCAHLIKKYLHEYNGVLTIDAQVLYNHTKVDSHIDGCECGMCSMARVVKALPQDTFSNPAGLPAQK